MMQPSSLPAAAVEEDIKALVELRDPVRWSFNHERAAIQIEVGNDVVKAVWPRLGQNRVWIRISEHGNLRGVFCSGVTFDPKRRAEEEWLDHVGA